jgi:hypothetical protein
MFREQPPHQQSRRLARLRRNVMHRNGRMGTPCLGIFKMATYHHKQRQAMPEKMRDTTSSRRLQREIDAESEDDAAEVAAWERRRNEADSDYSSSDDETNEEEEENESNDVNRSDQLSDSGERRRVNNDDVVHRQFELDSEDDGGVDQRVTLQLPFRGKKRSFTALKDGR